MSTCSMKCTPPRRSSPRNMGRAWMALSHAGVREIWLSATTKLGSFASGTRAFWITSFALSWFSSVSKRARTEVPSTATRSAVRLAAARACSTRCATASSILTPLLTAETCTAGVSPKKLGRLYKAPTSSTITRIAHFQTGYRFMIALLPHGQACGAGSTAAPAPDEGWRRPPPPRPDFRLFTSPYPWAALAPRRCAGSALPRCWRFRCAGNLRTGV